MRGLKKRLVFNYGIIIILTVLIMEGLFLLAIRHYYYDGVEQSLRKQATVSADFYNKYLGQYNLKDKGRYIFENTPSELVVRVEVLNGEHTVITDSNGFHSECQTDTSDVEEALAGKTAVWTGKDNLTDERVMAVSNPLYYNEQLTGVLRYVTSLEMIDSAVARISSVSLLIGLMVILLALTFSLLLARSIIEPIQELTAAAGQMAMGNFSYRASKRRDDEIGNLADTLNYMAEEISKSDKLKNDFIASVSHELRTPLTSIKGWGETLILGDLEDKEETIQGLEIIANETDRLIGLVEDLLDFSHFQAGRIQVKPVKMNLNWIIEDLGRQFSFRAKEKNISFLLSIDEEAGEIMGDPDRLKQVFINLLDNALKFTGENGRICLISRKIDQGVEIEVEDNGSGIDEDDLHRVCEKFYKGSSKYSGSGLGLSICSEIVKLHRGEIKINSKAGEGSRVTVILPDGQ